jgi:hypothetical protein
MDNSQPDTQPTPQDILQATNQAVLKKRQQSMQQFTNSFPQYQISQAMATVNPKSNAPQAQIGKAISTPNYAGLCLKWVDDQQGNSNRQPTAYADYQAHAQQGDVSASLKDIPIGARTYFSPNDSNGGLGHVGIYAGNGKFISATDNGIKTFAIKDWEAATGQSFLGWVPKS